MTQPFRRPAAKKDTQSALLWWVLGLLLLLVFGISWLKPLFASLFPQLQRPVYEQVVSAFGGFATPTA